MSDEITKHWDVIVAHWERQNQDMMMPDIKAFGIHVTRNGQRIDPLDFFPVDKPAP